MHFHLKEFLERAEKYAHLIKDGSLLVDPQEFEEYQQRTMSVFAVDKHKCKIYQSTKDVFKALTSLGVLPLQIVWGVGVFMWDVLLPMPYDCMSMINRDLITKDLIPSTKYRGMRKTRSACSCEGRGTDCLFQTVWADNQCLL